MSACMCYFPDHCDGGGVLVCDGCGGDLCVCQCGGEMECPGCEFCNYGEPEDDDYE